MRGALPLLLLLAAPVLAEGRKDSVLGCDFDGLGLVLSQDGEGFTWSDDSGRAGPAQCAGFGSAAAVCLLEAPDAPLTLTVTTGAEGHAAPFGIAALTTPELPPDGALDLASQAGRCEALTP